MPGRDIMVQGWYQGGVNIFDFTDPARPYRDRLLRSRSGQRDQIARYRAAHGARTTGTATSTRRSCRADWIFSSCTPSEFLSQNEIDAAKLVRMEEYNPQAQPHITWPAAFPVVRSYLDQLVRNQGLSSERTTAIATAINNAERANGSARRDQLNRLATQLDSDANGAGDSARVRAMAAAVRALAQATQ